MIDRFSRWPEAIPMKDMKAETVAKEFYNHWISRFDSPTTITSDQGTQFESSLFQNITQIIGAHKTRTTAYHPQSNGIVEKMHRTLKGALMCSTKPWYDILPIVLLGLRTVFKEDIQASPAEMLYGTCLKIPGEFIVSSDISPEPNTFIDKFREIMREIRPHPTAHHTKSKIFISKDLKNCSHVWLRCDQIKAPLQPPYKGPYQVAERISERVYKINVDEQFKNISVERLKPCYINKNDEQSLTPNQTQTFQSDLAQQLSSITVHPKQINQYKVTFNIPDAKSLRGE